MAKKVSVSPHLLTHHLIIIKWKYTGQSSSQLWNCLSDVVYIGGMPFQDSGWIYLFNKNVSCKKQRKKFISTPASLWIHLKLSLGAMMHVNPSCSHKMAAVFKTSIMHKWPTCAKSLKLESHLPLSPLHTVSFIPKWTCQNLILSFPAGQWNSFILLKRKRSSIGVRKLKCLLLSDWLIDQFHFYSSNTGSPRWAWICRCQWPQGW